MAETLTEQVARHIENLIVFGRLGSGERIYEAAMAKQMEVSHGSIREGLLLLEKRHLVRNVPRKGAFVTDLDDYFVRSLYVDTATLLADTGRKACAVNGNQRIWSGWNSCINRWKITSTRMI